MMDATLVARRYNMAFLWRVCLVVAMGGLLFGYDYVVIGGAKPFYEPFFGIADAPFWQGFAMTAALFGCIAGALISGGLSDRLGRKRLLIAAALLFTLSAVWTGLAESFVSFNAARFLGGVGIGLASSLSPMYIAEISPAEMRGRFVAINQLTIVIGILAAQLMNWAIAHPVPTVDQIRILVGERSAADAARDSFSEDEMDRARAIADRDALDAVARDFPGIRFRKLDASASKEQKEAKAAEDAQIMNRYLRETWNGRYGWRWMFGAETAPAVAFFLLMFLVPESPRWLVKNGRSAEAGRILARVGGEAYAQLEVDDIQRTIAAEEVAQVHFRDLLEPKLAKVVALGVFLAVFQQWCGINVIFNYAQEVFKAAGYEVGDLMFSIVITGVVNLIFTFVAIFTVDRIGRRPLMLLGAGGLAVIYALLGVGFFLHSTGIHMLILVVSVIGCFAMTLGPIVWVVISEIFPNRIRGAAMSIAVLSLWIGCTTLNFTFPILNKALSTHGVFWLYGAVCVVGLVVIHRQLPETKGKSLEEIERELVD